MNLSLLWRGMAIGFAIAAPVGPIGLLCIQRTLQSGRKQGLLSGLGAATADACYGCVAGFGLTWVSSFLLDQRQWLSLIGGLFLCYLGLRTFVAQPATEAAATRSDNLATAYVMTLALTLTNPMTILSFVAIFAGLGLATAGSDYLSAILLVLGVFLGSAAWWLLLSSSVSLLRGRFDAVVMRWVNRAAGFIIAGFGLYTLITLR
jgi:threonine/homoserine/homoserine lactone efflux protein